MYSIAHSARSSQRQRARQHAEAMANLKLFMSCRLEGMCTDKYIETRCNYEVYLSLQQTAKVHVPLPEMTSATSKYAAAALLSIGGSRQTKTALTLLTKTHAMPVGNTNFTPIAGCQICLTSGLGYTLPELLLETLSSRPFNTAICCFLRPRSPSSLAALQLRL